MTTEDDFHAALDRDPGDGLLRGMLADWLDEHARDVPCRACEGYGRVFDGGGSGLMTTVPATRDNVIRFSDDRDCPTCRGTGTVSDGRRERAAGYRWLAQAGQIPECATPFGPPEWTWWESESFEQTGPAYLPRAVMRSVWDATPDAHRDAYHHAWTEHTTRREADDAAALAFGRLPADVQARILAGVTA